MAIRTPEPETGGWSRGRLTLLGFAICAAAPLIVGLIPGLIEHDRTFLNDGILAFFVLIFVVFVGGMGAIAGYFAGKP